MAADDHLRICAIKFDQFVEQEMDALPLTTDCQMSMIVS